LAVDYWGGISGSDLDTSSSESESDSNDDSSPVMSRATSRIDIRKNRGNNILNTPHHQVEYPTLPVAKKARVKSPIRRVKSPIRMPVKSPSRVKSNVRNLADIQNQRAQMLALKSPKVKSVKTNKSPDKLGSQDILSRCLEILNNDGVDMSDSETQPVPDVPPPKSPEMSPLKKLAQSPRLYDEGLLKIAETTKEAKSGGGEPRSPGLVETQDVTKLKPLTITVSTAPVKVPTNNNLVAQKTMSSGHNGYEGLVTTTTNNAFKSTATTTTNNTSTTLVTTASNNALGGLMTTSSINGMITAPSNPGNNGPIALCNKIQMGQNSIQQFGQNNGLLVKQLPQLQPITPQSVTVKPEPLLNSIQPPLVSTIHQKLGTNQTIQVKPTTNLLQSNIQILQPNIQQPSQPHFLLPPPQQAPVPTQQAIIQIIQPPGLPLQLTNSPLPLLNAQGHLMGTINGCTTHGQLLTNLQKFVQMLPSNNLKLEQPTNNLVQPVNNLNLAKPTNNINFMQPSNNLKLLQPSNNLNIVQPSNNINLLQPSNNLNLMQPATNLNLTQPINNLNLTQPATSLNLTQPATNLNLTQPTNHLNFVQPNNLIAQPQSQPITQNGLSFSQPQISSVGTLTFQQPSVINTSGMSFQQPNVSTINTSSLSFQQPTVSTINTNSFNFQQPNVSAINTSSLNFQQPNVSSINTSGLNFQQPTINTSGLNIQQPTVSSSPTNQASHQLVQDPTTGMYQLVQTPQPPPVLQNNQLLGGNFELVNNPSTPLPASVLTPQITPKIEPRNCSTPFSIKSSPIKMPKLLLPSMSALGGETKENKPLLDNTTKFMCGVCNKFFGNTKNLRVHISEIHEGNRGHFPCDICNKVFPRKRNMERHKNAVHLKNNPRCHLCQKLVVNIEMHVKRFHKESPGEVNNKISVGFNGILSSAVA